MSVSDALPAGPGDLSHRATRTRIGCHGGPRRGLPFSRPVNDSSMVFHEGGKPMPTLRSLRSTVSVSGFALVVLGLFTACTATPAAPPASTPAAAAPAAAQSTPQATAQPAAQASDATLRVGISAPLNSMKPVGLQQTSMTYNRAIYDALINVGPRGTLLPHLATSWDVSADGLTLTLHIRSGV